MLTSKLIYYVEYTSEQNNSTIFAHKVGPMFFLVTGPFNAFKRAILSASVLLVRSAVIKL